MSEDSIFRELQEDIQRQRLNDIWKKHGKLLIGVAVATVLGTSAGVAWKHMKNSRNQGYTSSLLEAMQAKDADIGKQREAFGEAMETADGHAHATLAALQLASAEVQEKNGKEALAIYREVIEDGHADPALQNLAKVLAVNTAVQFSLDAGDITPPKEGGAFYAEWLEANAWKALKDGDTADAVAQFRAITESDLVSPTMKQRMQTVISLLAPGVKEAPAKEESSAEEEGQ